MNALEKIKKNCPKGRWWIKADACDVRLGLRESVAGKWSGDENLDDGVLEKLRKEYEERLQFVKSIGIASHDVGEDFMITVSVLENDKVFLSDGIVSARESYERRRLQSNASESALMGLAWNLVGFEGLQTLSSELMSNIKLLVENLQAPKSREKNEMKELKLLKQKLLEYTKQLYTKKRTAASHLMVFMIADESRNMKPYAVPVRVLPYASIKDEQLRELSDHLRMTMVGMGLVVGMFFL